MDILCTYCMPSIMLHLWNIGIEEVAGLWPELGTVQKLEFMESESRCLSGHVGHTYCGTQLSLPSWFPLQTREVVPEATRLPIQNVAQRPTCDVVGECSSYWPHLLTTSQSLSVLGYAMTLHEVSGYSPPRGETRGKGWAVLWDLLLCHPRVPWGTRGVRCRTLENI